MADDGLSSQGAAFLFSLEFVQTLDLLELLVQRAFYSLNPVHDHSRTLPPALVQALLEGVFHSLWVTFEDKFVQITFKVKSGECKSSIECKGTYV